MTRARSLLFLVITWAGLLITAWTLADLTLSATGSAPADRGVETVHHAGRGYALKEGLNDMVCVDKHGLRRSRPLPPRVPGERRILMLGESTCFSYYVVQGQDWPARAEGELRQRGVLATTMNGGVPGYDSRDVFAALNWYKARLPVDLVVRYEAWNSFFAYNGIAADCARDFYFDATARKLFPGWPDSLEPAPAYRGWLELVPTSPTIPTKLKWLNPIVQNTALGHALYKHVLPRFLPNRDTTPAPSGGLAPLTNPERYVLHLGAFIRSAQELGITPVLLLPFTVVRIPGYGWDALPEHQKAYLSENFRLQASNWQNLVRIVGAIDQTCYGFAARTKAVVIDPAPRMLKELNTGNAFGEGYSTYMKTLHHTGEKGDRLLGVAVAEGLLAKGLVSPVPSWQPGHPVLHPGEVAPAAVPALSYPRAGRFMTARKVLAAFALSLALALCGSMLLIALHGSMPVNLGWALPLGLAAGAALLSIFSQFMPAGSCLGLSCAFVFLASSACAWRKGLLGVVTWRYLSWRLPLLGAWGALLLVGLDALLARQLLSASWSSHTQYAGWVQLLADYSRYLDDKEFLFRQLEQARHGSDGFLFFLLELHKNPALVRPLAPLLAAGLARTTGLDPAAALGLSAGLASFLAFPCFWAIARGRLGPVSWLFAALAAATLLLSARLVSPPALAGSLGCCLAAYATWMPGSLARKAILLIPAGGLLFVLPTPWALFLILGLGLAFPAGVRGPSKLGQVAGVCLLVSFALLAGKALVPWFPGLSFATTTWLENQVGLRSFIDAMPTAPMWPWVGWALGAALCMTVSLLCLRRSAWRLLPSFLMLAVAAWALLPKGFEGLAPYALIGLSAALLTREHGTEAPSAEGTARAHATIG